MATTVQESRAFAENVTGYRFRNGDLLLAALVAAKHKRMALVGDAVLKIAILDDWYYDGTTIGRDRAQPAAKIGREATLQAWARQVDLGPLIYLNAGQVPGGISARQLSDAVEALIMAIWLDTGKDLDVIKQVIRTMDLASFANV
ncbi:hypothetical protein KC345_g4326 [Hortaea werneckii]|nr:hypothetical protein KC345_g4326 [Hortaea werneckii]